MSLPVCESVQDLPWPMVCECALLGVSMPDPDMQTSMPIEFIQKAQAQALGHRPHDTCA
jgi:hypothetical protein